MQDLIGRTVGPAVTVETAIDPNAWTVLCDANQLENAILNLSLNGRDAMPDGGRLILGTANTVLDEAAARQSGMAPGDYLCVSVGDTGQGMSPETLARAFEPFFTTKPMGQGTGLGLSMVYGFARQSGGVARLSSVPDQGTTVRIYMPRHRAPVAPEASVAAARPSPVLAGSQTVLVVDDEPMLRGLLAEVLEEQGYRVLQAGDGAEAVALLRQQVGIDLLLTDVGLPGTMNGRALADTARTLRHGIKVLFMTGYVENAALLGGMLDATTQVMTKPFTMHALLLKVRGIVAPAV